LQNSSTKLYFDLRTPLGNVTGLSNCCRTPAVEVAEVPPPECRPLLEVAKTVKSELCPSQTCVYEIAVRNISSCPFKGELQLLDYLPDRGSEFALLLPSSNLNLATGGHCTTPSSTLECEMGTSLPPGAAAFLTIQASRPKGGDDGIEKCIKDVTSKSADIKLLTECVKP
jgi:hypothetical protein